MNPVDVNGVAYSILIAKEGCSVGEAAKKAIRIGSGEPSTQKDVEGALIDFLLNLATPYDMPLTLPTKGELLDVMEAAVTAYAKGEPFELKGHGVDPKEVVKSIRIHICRGG